MNCRLVAARELDAPLLRRWRELQRTDPVLGGAFFCPEFVQAVAATRADVYVGVLEREGAVVGFFPHQRNRFGIGTPVGGRLSDFHGVIAVPGLDFDPAWLLARCRLNAWDFHHLPASQTAFSAGFRTVENSLYIDLSAGYEAYVATMRARGAKYVKDAGYKLRKLAREHGEVRFEPAIADPAVLRTLMDWKANQYLRKGLVNVFGFPWTRDLLERIQATDGPGFGGRLSGLYAGDRLVAMHMGMATPVALNWWFPRHDEAFKAYSPGILLRLKAAEHAAAEGVLRLDIGVADATSYKQHLATGAIPIAEGSVARPSLTALGRSALAGIESMVRASPLHSLLRAPGRRLTAAMRRSRFK